MLIKKITSINVEEILSLLVYFDIFEHPLTPSDMMRMTGLSETTIHDQLRMLVTTKICFEWQGYYGLTPYTEEKAQRRIQAERNAEMYWPKVKKYARIIANFPFVKGVAISGSLSKGVMTDQGDIDFFIITEPNRLWITRSLLILYKKIRLLNSRKYFCLNYFVDTNNLGIIDENIFTAVEVAHLIPVYAEEKLFEKFYIENQWVVQFIRLPSPINSLALPTDPFYGLSDNIKIKKSKYRKEKWLSGSFGNYLEQWTHKKTLKRWMRKFGHFDENKFELTMRSTIGVSKHHPQDFQSRVLDIYTQRLNFAQEKLNEHMKNT
jgi:hypothetical protein